MSFEITNITGISRRRQNRWASKKRKVEEFLNLVEGEESNIQKLKISANVEGEDQIMQKVPQSVKDEIPVFYLTEHGFKAQVNFKFYNPEKPLGQTIAPLFIEDIQHLLLKVMHGGSSQYNLRWGKFECIRKINHVVLIIVDGLSKDDIVRHRSLFRNMLDIFPDMVEVVAPASYNLNFATALCGVHMTLAYHPKTGEQNNGIGTYTSHKALSSIFPKSPCPKSLDIVIKDDFLPANEVFSRLHLLLNPLQLALENFPLPVSVLEDAGTKDYCFSKTKYTHVTAESPLFALDCEMCRMKSGKMEVTKIAVVDEDLNVVYETLVKPKGHVADYLTKYSGVDKEMLEPIKTSLSDVQQHLQAFLPSDAILCGQSLNFDLHALNMIHPYIIDTSVIFNTSGLRTKKTSLRVLSEIFLKLVIQDGKKGHDPIEDCVAAMKLVLLKLRNGPVFGDAILASCMKSEKSKKALGEVKLNIASTTEQNDQLIDKSLSTRFFPKLQNDKKIVCIVTDMVSYAQYPQEMLSESILRAKEVNMRKAVKKSSELIPQCDLTVCHINPVTSDKTETQCIQAIDKYINRLYTACTNKDLFIVVAAGKVKSDDSCENALCMIRLKVDK